MLTNAIVVSAGHLGEARGDSDFGATPGRAPGEIAEITEAPTLLAIEQAPSVC